MNKEVKVTNMEVRALAEDGLLINEVATASDSHWDEEATANQTGSGTSVLFPASTANGTTWYHASSTKYDDAAAATAVNAKSSNLVNAEYQTLSGTTAITDMSASATAGSQAFRETMGTSATARAGYYVHYTYYLKSSAGSALDLTGSNPFKVSIKEVKATTTAAAGGSGSANLDKALRVGIRLNSEFYIYAPVNGYTSTYYVNASTETAPHVGNEKITTDLASLPAVSSDGTPVQVYIWYEGEDANCKSSEAVTATLDNIQVEITFCLDGTR